jgi:hypothetical protein
MVSRSSSLLRNREGEQILLVGIRGRPDQARFDARFFGQVFRGGVGEQDPQCELIDVLGLSVHVVAHGHGQERLEAVARQRRR